MGKTALVLSGGGAKGAFQVTAEKYARTVKGYTWDLIAGVSVGALNGAMYAQERYAELEDLWQRITRKDIYTGGLDLGLVWRLLILKRRSLFDNTPLWRLIQQYVEPDRLQIPFTVGAASLETGVYKAFDKDHESFLRAIFASATMPVIWEPVQGVAGFPDAVDGGLRNITPLKDVIAEDPDEIVVINCHARDFAVGAVAERPKDIAKVALRSLEIALHEIFVSDVEECLKINRLVRQAEAQGVTLTHDDGRPYKHFEVKVIEPAGPLDDTLDFSREAIERSLAAGRERAEAVLGS
jgi:NTE family protein